jgi:fermentation-respiration switch protein FrsA (DUF1100 family)
MMLMGLTNPYEVLDRPEILRLLFHPRPEGPLVAAAPGNEDILIPVESDVRLGARFHLSDHSAPNLLFFHGNGEIVADYDDLGPLYNEIPINFLPVDYRGYGRSSGTPTVATMMQDSHLVFEYVRRWLAEKGYGGPLLIMGRSLGSASALELAAAYADAIAGLIVESGFAFAGPLLKLLGVPPEVISFSEQQGFRNLDKIASISIPTLVIHAENDHIIPFSDGQALYDASPAANKTLLKIPHANHNDILFRGVETYMTAIKSFAAQLSD